MNSVTRKPSLGVGRFSKSMYGVCSVIVYLLAEAVRNTTNFAGSASLLERGVQQIIHRGCRLVTRHKALAKITGEVVVRCRRAGLDNPADGLSESFLHSQPGKRF